MEQERQETPPAVLSLRDLTVSLPGGAGRFDIVRGVSLDLQRGEILGLVGESGSGKSLTLKAIMRLLPGAMQPRGSVIWKGQDVLAADAGTLRRLRGAEMSMIFQEPMTALNPVLSIGRQIDESLKAHTALDRRARHRRAVELLDLVGIPSAERRLRDYPFQFSGGMRQRAMIAIALACDPQLVLADEPTTALDVTIQDQILQLLLRLRDELGLSVIFVTHDLGVVSEICDRTAIMYAGEIVETGATRTVLSAPLHPYTQGLLRSMPGAAAADGRLNAIPGQPPLPAARAPGCAFAPRCAMAGPACSVTDPVLGPVLGPIHAGHASACLRATDLIAEGGQP